MMKLIRKIAGAVTSSFLITGILSLIWLLLRSGTKPSRINYPCQKTSAANAALLVSAMPAMALPHFLSRWHCPHCRKKAYKKMLAAVPLVLVLATALVPGSRVYAARNLEQQWTKTRLAERHAALGLLAGPALGLTGCGTESNPGTAVPFPANRIVSVHSSSASTWEGSANPQAQMDQDAINAMVSAGLMELTGTKTAADAWRALIPYRTGEAVAIKLNFNNTYGDQWYADPAMNPYAELVNALIGGLTAIGVPTENIWLTDPSRVINDSFRERITAPGVRYYVRPGADLNGRENVIATGFVAADSPYASISQATAADTVVIRPAQVFVDAAHIINVPQLKGHGGASITLGLKNHFGSIDIGGAQGDHAWHDFFYVDSIGDDGATRNLLADISANPVFRDKTRLIVGDGLMGHPTINWQDPVLWQTFGNQPPEILFFGTDPLAADSVMFDFLQAECSAIGETPRNGDILHYAASIGLGLHEHWNSSTDRQYSAIDYRALEMN